MAQARWLIAVAIGAIATGCPPEGAGTHTRWMLTTSDESTMVGASGVHVVVRVDPSVLAEADLGVALVLGTDFRNAIVVIPDGPDARGISTFASTRLDITEALGAACPTAGPCETGFTVLREQMPSTMGVAPSDVSFVAVATSTERAFTSATLELQLDGGPIRSATRSQYVY